VLQWAATQGAFFADTPPRLAWHVLEGILWATAMLLLLLAPLLTKPLLCNPLLEKMGVVSYSLFLIHFPILANATDALRRRFPGRFETWDAETTAAMAVLLSLCLAASTLTYLAIERPFLARKARLPR
jgi:peptidoglycan/LPS O-acetylase OafA/YrhL